MRHIATVLSNNPPNTELHNCREILGKFILLILLLVILLILLLVLLLLVLLLAVVVVVLALIGVGTLYKLGLYSKVTVLVSSGVVSVPGVGGGVPKKPPELDSEVGLVLLLDTPPCPDPVTDPDPPVVHTQSPSPLTATHVLY